MQLVATTAEDRERIFDFLESRAAEMGLRARLFREGAQDEHGWLLLPVRIEGIPELYENVSRLQELEDAWNNQEPAPEHKISLIPASYAGTTGITRAPSPRTKRVVRLQRSHCGRDVKGSPTTMS